MMFRVWLCVFVVYGVVDGVVLLDDSDDESASFDGVQNGQGVFEGDEPEDELNLPPTTANYYKGHLLVRTHTERIIRRDVQDPMTLSYDADDVFSHVLEHMNYNDMGDDVCGYKDGEAHGKVHLMDLINKKWTSIKTYDEQTSKDASSSACWAFTSSLIMSTLNRDAFSAADVAGSDLKFKKYCRAIFAVRPHSTKGSYWGFPMAYNDESKVVTEKAGVFWPLAYFRTGLHAIDENKHINPHIYCKVRAMRKENYDEGRAQEMLNDLINTAKRYKRKIAGAIGIAWLDPNDNNDYHYAPFVIDDTQQDAASLYPTMTLIDGYDDGTGKWENNRKMYNVQYTKKPYYTSACDKTPYLAVTYGKSYQAIDNGILKERTFDKHERKMLHNREADDPMRDTNCGTKFPADVVVDMTGVKPTNRLIACTSAPNDKKNNVDTRLYTQWSVFQKWMPK